MSTEDLPDLDNEFVNDIDTLVRRSVEGAVLRDSTPDGHSSLALVRVRGDEHVQPVDLERYLSCPRRNRGTATVRDPGDFGIYAARLRTDRSTAWADEAAARITLVVNDVDGGPDDIGGEGLGEMGWRDHRAVLALQPDPDWQAWTDADGKGVGQEEFAEFLQDQAHTIVAPSSADLLEIVTTFQAAQSGSFGRAIRLDNGSVKMNFTQETTGSAGQNGELEIPKKFTITLTPFLGGDTVEMEVWLRYRITSGNLKIGFKLDRPDLVKRAAFEKIRGTVAEKLSPVPVLMGTAPDPVASADPTEHHAPPADVSGIVREVRELRALVTGRR